MSSITENSTGGGLVTVTIPAGPAAIRPSSQPCRSCMVRHFSGTATFMNIEADAVAASSWPLGTTIHPVPIKNLNMLSFIGTAGDKVQIMWRS